MWPITPGSSYSLNHILLLPSTVCLQPHMCNQNTGPQHPLCDIQLSIKGQNKIDTFCLPGLARKCGLGCSEQLSLITRVKCYTDVDSVSIPLRKDYTYSSSLCLCESTIFAASFCSLWSSCLVEWNVLNYFFTFLGTFLGFHWFKRKESITTSYSSFVASLGILTETAFFTSS